MREELLKEFIIEEYGDSIYSVIATDKAYKMLGLTDKILPDKRYPFDSMPIQYYRAAILHWLHKNYTIDGLIRESRGNSHDASWQKEVTIINKEGIWKDKFEKFRNQKPGCYEHVPVIKEIQLEDLTPDMIDKWARTYDKNGDGEEEDGRYVLIAGANNTRYAFHFGQSHVLSTANAKSYSWHKSETSGSYAPIPRTYRALGFYVEKQKESIE